MRVFHALANENRVPEFSEASALTLIHLSLKRMTESMGLFPQVHVSKPGRPFSPEKRQEVFPGGIERWVGWTLKVQSGLLDKGLDFISPRYAIINLFKYLQDIRLENPFLLLGVVTTMIYVQ